ncbi:hypothetical protein PYCCODRAFT_359499 [Trametes coccinea BRFM310]|uniref:Uncharacterized protein n=1 Tax=Trametes coccinea (strain BRFM310) TaxID=1353009 RepID=A0A1Y2J4N6_TRAC3|nr:hypothetical protein PYCCODRAFT_359499 [Trametes coccinea BRFM310]
MLGPVMVDARAMLHKPYVPNLCLNATTTLLRHPIQRLGVSKASPLPSLLLHTNHEIDLYIRRPIEKPDCGYNRRRNGMPLSRHIARIYPRPNYGGDVTYDASKTARPLSFNPIETLDQALTCEHLHGEINSLHKPELSTTAHCTPRQRG